MILVILFALLSPALSALLYFTLFPQIHPLFMLPIAFGMFWILCLLWVLFILINAKLAPKDQPKRYRPYYRAVTLLTLGWFLCLFRVRLRVKGMEKIPKEPFILISNHRSAMDAVFGLCAFKKRKMAFIAKSEVMKYPIVGAHILNSGFLGIERDKPLASLRVINRAAKYVKEEKMDYGIFPEGTRTKDGKVGEFKEGAFLAAKKADAPIVLITTEGSESFWKHFPLGSPKITLTVREIISRETVAAEDVGTLSRLARNAICRALGEEETTANS